LFFEKIEKIIGLSRNRGVFLVVRKNAVQREKKNSGETRKENPHQKDFDFREQIMTSFFDFS